MAIQDKFNRTSVIYKITKDIDLGGETLTIPEGCTLDFQGGSFSNGTIVGNNTYISGNTINIFKAISFKGKWNIETVNSEMFDAYEGYELLQTISSLLSNDKYNKVILNGNISIKFPKNVSNALIPTSHTDIIINGIISVQPNNFTHYRVIYLEDVSDVNIRGGIIMGDVESHISNEGEYGMGISIVSSKIVSISDIKIINMWGDGIYIGRKNYDSPTEVIKSENITINNISCSYNRRQGISLTCCSKVSITASTFYGTGAIKYTAPGYGIDIEPNNQYDTIFDVEIAGCTFSDNISESMDKSIIIYAIHHNVKNVRIHDNTLSGRISITGLRNSYISSNKIKEVVLGELEENNMVYLTDNVINADENFTIANSIISENNLWNRNSSGYIVTSLNSKVTKITVPKFNGQINVSVINRSTAPGSVFLDKEFNIKTNYNFNTYKKSSVKYFYGDESSRSTVGEVQLQYSIKMSDGIEEDNNIVFYLVNPRDSFGDTLFLTFKQLWLDGFEKISKRSIIIENVESVPENVELNFLESIDQNVVVTPRVFSEHCELHIGASIYDYTRQKQIWWTGTKWVDATGTEV